MENEVIMKKIILSLLCLSLGSLQAAMHQDHIAQIQATLLMAAERGDLDIVQRLITTPGININYQDSHERSALRNAAIGGHRTIVQALINTPGIDINLQDSAGWTALMYVALKEDMPTVHALTGAGANIHLRTHGGLCPADILIKESRAKTKSAGNHQI